MQGALSIQDRAVLPHGFFDFRQVVHFCDGFGHLVGKGQDHGGVEVLVIRADRRARQVQLGRFQQNLLHIDRRLAFLIEDRSNLPAC